MHSLSLSQTHTHSLFLSLSLSLSDAHAQTCTHSHSPTITQRLTQTLSLSLSFILVRNVDPSKAVELMRAEREKENIKYGKQQKKQDKMLFVAFYILLNLVSQWLSESIHIWILNPTDRRIITWKMMVEFKKHGTGHEIS